MDQKQFNKFKALNEALCYWLGYQFKIGRERLIHEASLRYPIADVLTSEGTEIKKIQLEKGHPCFIDRLVDIFIFDKPINEITKVNLTSSIDEIYELKIAKKDTGTKYGQEHQRVVDDILRLAYFNKSTKKDAYFIICGNYQDFKNYFIGQKDEPTEDSVGNIIIKEQNSQIKADGDTASNKWDTENSLYKEYFDFEFSSFTKSKLYTFNKNTITDLDFTINSKSGKKTINKEKYFGLNSFQDKYEIKDDLFEWEEYIKIKTTCITITPFEATTNRTHACGIWKIEAEN